MQPATNLMHGDSLLQLIRTALAEDIGAGDVTSNLLLPETMQAEMIFTARAPMVICGVHVPQMVYGELDRRVEVTLLAKDGDTLPAGGKIAKVKGPARAILTGERVVLNIMQRMSGVATVTRRYVDAVAGTKAKILDTRKTMPGMRLLDKYAVTVGGGMNHRMRLDDMVIIKDNHIAIAGSVKVAVESVKAALNGKNIPVVVECDTLVQLAQALEAKPDRIMLDNMNVDSLLTAVQMTAGQVKLEATGGVTFSNIRSVAETGVDYISIGAITHSVPAVDIGLDAA